MTWTQCGGGELKPLCYAGRWGEKKEGAHGQETRAIERSRLSRLWAVESPLSSVDGERS